MLTKIHVQRFTAFEELELEFSPGINVFIGANATGKTHIMKAAYAACDITKTKANFTDKLVEVFLPSGRALGRLIKRHTSNTTGSINIYRDNLCLSATFPNVIKDPGSVTVRNESKWKESPLESVYIPVKEMLSNAPGFRSLYAQREIHFEAIYSDILDRAYRPALRGPMDKQRRRLSNLLEKAIAGKVKIKNEEFFVRSQQGNLEFSLVAEGVRKLALLWLLIQNGTLLQGSVLFWDEPETNLNPKLFATVIEVLLELQRLGVQIFLATHDYVILKQLDLQKTDSDSVAFHSLYRDESGEIRNHTAETYLDIHPNAIADAFDDIYNKEIERTIGTGKNAGFS